MLRSMFLASVLSQVVSAHSEPLACFNTHAAFCESEAESRALAYIRMPFGNMTRELDFGLEIQHRTTSEQAPDISMALNFGPSKTELQFGTVEQRPIRLTLNASETDDADSADEETDDRWTSEQVLGAVGIAVLIGAVVALDDTGEDDCEQDEDDRSLLGCLSFGPLF